MGLVDLHVLAGGLLVGGHEGGVDVLVKLARHVIGDIEQGYGLGRRLGECGARGRERRADEATRDSVLLMADALRDGSPGAGSCAASGAPARPAP